MKTFVIAMTTYREIVRRQLLWLLALVASGILVLSAVIPYHTFGEDIKMVKDQGLAVITVAGLIIALFSASVSIADEIEGKTALTLLSKPINRRNFILGKFAGIMAAIALLFVLLGIVFMAVLFYKVGYDAHESRDVVPGYWDRVSMLREMLPGLLLTYFKVSILCALGVALSTRFPLHLNITVCIIVYMLGHLAPLMVQAEGQFEAVQFMARFFATILPNLEYFNVGPAISADVTVPWVSYVLPCFAYCVLYTANALLLGLLLFEDRDLA